METGKPDREPIWHRQAETERPIPSRNELTRRQPLRNARSCAGRFRHRYCSMVRVMEQIPHRAMPPAAADPVFRVVCGRPARFVPTAGFSDRMVVSRMDVFETAHRRQIPIWNSADTAICGRLNGFFAISVNSPSMSMVNCSCCVCSAPQACAPGLTRPVTSQPMRTAVRMEAGTHACL